MNCDALLPGGDENVVFRSNFAASRIRLLFKPPHRPLSVLTTMTRAFFDFATFHQRMVELRGARRPPAHSTSFIKSA